MLVLKAALLLCTGMISYQDFKQRAVHVVWFTLLLATILFLELQTIDYQFLWQSFATNLFLLLIQWLGLTLYFSIKAGSLINIMDQFIGWGDAVLLLVLALYFTPLIFALFLISSLVLVLFIALFRTLLIPSKKYIIPLAGWIGVFFISFEVARLSFPAIGSITEYSIMQHLSQLAIL